MGHHWRGPGGQGGTIGTAERAPIKLLKGPRDTLELPIGHHWKGQRGATGGPKRHRWNWRMAVTGMAQGAPSLGTGQGMSYSGPTRNIGWNLPLLSSSTFFSSASAIWATLFKSPFLCISQINTTLKICRMDMCKLRRTNYGTQKQIYKRKFLKISYIKREMNKRISQEIINWMQLGKEKKRKNRQIQNKETREGYDTRSERKQERRRNT